MPPNKLDTVAAAFQGLGYALSSRALLLLSLIGAFVLAIMAMNQQTMFGLYVLVAYCLLTVIPIVTLEMRRR